MADAGDGSGQGSSSDSGDVVAAKAGDAPEDGKVCGIDFGKIPTSALALYVSKKACLRCKIPVANHKCSVRAPEQVDRPVVPAGAGYGPAMASAAAAPAPRGLMKKLQEATEALAVQSSFHIVVDEPEWQPVDVHRLIRAANSAHFGWTGIVDLTYGELPERPTRKALLQVFARSEHFASIIDVIKSALMRKVAMVAREDDGNDRFPRADVFVGGKGHVTTGAAEDLVGALDFMAIGLRAIAKRDAAVYARAYASAEAKLAHPTLGSGNWFIVLRNRALDRVQTFISSIVSAPVLKLPEPPSATSASAAGAAAAAAAGGAGAGAGAGGGGDDGAVAWVDADKFRKAFPWYAVGEAISARGGQEDTGVTDAVWEALTAQETVAAAAVVTITKERTGMKSKGARVREAAVAASDAEHGDDEDGSSSDARQKKGKRFRTRKVRTVAAAAAGAGAGGAAAGTRQTQNVPNADKLKARAALLGRDVETFEKPDCIKAGLCFKCKHPRHKAGKACTARGKQF